MPPLTVSLTGRLEIRVDGSVLDDERVPGRQARLLLAYLLLEHDRPVPRAELAEAVWGETPPPTWEKALTGLVGKLRRLLAECGLDARATLTSAFGCYQLLLPPGSSIDVEEAIAAAEEADRAFAAGELATAHDRAALAAAVAGRPLLPGEDGGWVEDRRRLLHDVRLRALDRLADVDIAAGELGEALASAEAAVREEPFRETGYQRLMRIHAAAGNVAEALRVFESLRRLLRDELGTTPSAPTRAIHVEILRQGAAAGDGAEDRFPDGNGSMQTRRPSRAGVFVAAGAALVLAAAAATAWEVGGGSADHSLRVTPNSLVAVDVRTLRPVAQVPVGVRPGGVVSAAGSLWVANLDDRTVSRIDPGSAALQRTIEVPDVPNAIVAGADSVWVVSANPGLAHVTLRRIDPRFDVVTRTTRVTASPSPVGTAALAYGRGSVWVAPSLGSIARISTATAAVQSSFDPYASATGIAVGAGAVWLVDRFGDTLARLDPTGATRTTPVGNGPSAIALGAGSVWVANGLDGTVSRIDPATGATRTTVRVGSPTALAVGAGAAWVANSRDGTVSRVDLRTNRVETIPVGGAPTGLALAGGRLWVTVATPLAPSPSAGGSVRVEEEQDVDSTDPAIAYSPSSWQLEYATCLKLFNYPDRPGGLGSQLEPEAAVELPRPSAGGTVYTIRVRSGFRFSPPSNEPVTAATFKYAIERSLSPRLGPGAVARSVVGGIVGLGAYEAGAAAHIAGVRVEGDALRIQLTRPMPTLPGLLALPFFCAVPIGTPVDPNGIRTIPSAGPYYVAASTPGQGVVLRRNPNYAGRRPHRLDQIDLGVGVLTSKAISDVVAGRADYTTGEIPGPDAVRLERLYGRAHATAEARPWFTVHPTLTTYFLAMNTSRPPFSDVRLRKAVNYAIDRSALARLGAGGHSLPLRPTDQYLPPAMAGTRHPRIYPLRPDLPRARRLVAGRQVHAVLYTCSADSCLQKAAVIERELARAGIVVEARTMSLENLFARLGTRGEPFDLAVVGWAADYPDPADFLNELLDGRSIRAHGNVDYAYFDDPTFNAKLAAADRLAGARRTQAYGGLELEISRDAAPLAAIGNPVQPDLLSARIGCAVYQPLYGIDLAALCVRHA